MNAEEYLTQLRLQIKDFSPQEQAELIEEIASHIETGENDPRLGPDPTDRANRLQAELGSPNDLGRGLRGVHRPNRWVDYLLVAIPSLLVIPLMPLVIVTVAKLTKIDLLSGMESSFSWSYFRVYIAFYSVLMILCVRKRSVSTLLYWLPTTILSIVALLLREGRLPWNPTGVEPGAPLETSFWLVALLALSIWLIKLLRQHRNEPMLVVLAVLPLLIAVANLVSGITERRLQGEQIEYINFTLGWFGLHQIAAFLWPALFYLPRQRAVRWLGLLTFTLPYLIYYTWPFRAHPLVLSLYILPVVMIIYVAARDLRVTQKPLYGR